MPVNPGPRLSVLFALCAYAAMQVGSMMYFRIAKHASIQTVLVVESIVVVTSFFLWRLTLRPSVGARDNGRR